jgi:preprotein translocase subunit SecE
VTAREFASHALAQAVRERYLASLACIDDRAADRPFRSRAAVRNMKDEQVAKVSPGEFARQVRAETAKVVWPTRKETITTAIMVAIMTAVLALFFFGVDSAFSALVQALLGLLN